MDRYPSTIENQSNWSFVWEGSEVIRGESRQYVPGYTTITVPGLYETQAVVVMIAAPARANWRLGGYMRAKASISFAGVGNVETNGLFCPVNRPILHLMPGFPSGYSFEFSIPNYIREVVIRMWRYSRKLETLQEIRDRERHTETRMWLQEMQFDLESELNNLNFTPQEPPP